MSDEKLDITLKDVETAIAVIETFLARMRKAESLLRKLTYYQHRMGVTGVNMYKMDMETLLGLAMEMERRKKVSTIPEESTPELSQEEVEKIRKIAKRLSSEEQRPTSSGV
jgi:phosphoenolpyruvate synthase/pyruvate phosphate dikinase